MSKQFKTINDYDVDDDYYMVTIKHEHFSYINKELIYVIIINQK